MSNSARKGRIKFWRQMAVISGGGGSTAVCSHLLNKHHKSNCHTKTTAVTHFWPEFLSFKEWFQNVAHPPPPFIQFLLWLNLYRSFFRVSYFRKEKTLLQLQTCFRFKNQVNKNIILLSFIKRFYRKFIAENVDFSFIISFTSL